MVQIHVTVQRFELETFGSLSDLNTCILKLRAFALGLGLLGLGLGMQLLHFDM